MDETRKTQTVRSKQARKRSKQSAPATDRAYMFTKSQILQGNYEGGELLSEGEVALVLGISRTPVREAFLRLESEGFLRLYPKKGALVVPVSVGEIEIVMETRRLIECYSLSKLLESGAEPELASHLEIFVARQEEALSQGNGQAFAEADREFHARIVESTHNAILIDLYHSLRDRQIRMAYTSISYDEMRSKTIMSEHRLIADNITNGNSNGAVEEMKSHLNGTLNALRRH